jgi:hypothetical protein
MITPIIRHQGLANSGRDRSDSCPPPSGEDSGGASVQSTPDNILYSFNLRQDFMVPEPKHRVTFLSQPSFPFCILSYLGVMLAAAFGIYGRLFDGDEDAAKETSR